MMIKARDFSVSPHALMVDSQFYLFDFRLDKGLTKFLVVDEAHLEQAPFLDINFEPLAKGSFSLPTLDLLALENQAGIERPPSSFIFHHAFVCSTLLARCLNQIDAFFALKEPWILRRLADAKRSGETGKVPRAQWKRMFRCYLMLLARNYTRGRAPVIKVTNVANNLLPEVFKYLPGHRSLYLYSDLESFLVSNLKKPQATQQKMPGLARNFVKDEDFSRRFKSFCEIDRLSFLQVCALIWLSNLYNFQANVKRTGSSNVRSLEMTNFLASPAESVGGLAAFFGHQPGPEEIARMVSPEVMERNAKQPNQQYNTGIRQNETSQVVARYGGQIKQAAGWIEPLIRETGVWDFMKSINLNDGPGPRG